VIHFAVLHPSILNPFREPSSILNPFSFGGERGFKYLTRLQLVPSPPRERVRVRSFLRDISPQTTHRYFLGLSRISWEEIESRNESSIYFCSFISPGRRELREVLCGDRRELREVLCEGRRELNTHGKNHLDL